jgi:hypothetical protein
MIIQGIPCPPGGGHLPDGSQVWQLKIKLLTDEMPMRKLHTQGNDYSGHSIWQLKIKL